MGSLMVRGFGGRFGAGLKDAARMAVLPAAAALLIGLGQPVAALAQAAAESQSIALTPPDPPPEGPGIEIPGTGITVTTSISISNDYLFRGISQTRNTWAPQATVDIAHESGFYIGGFISNATFLASPYNDTRQEVDALAGYRFTLGGVNLDIGYVGYFYPGQTKPEGTQLNQYNEVVLKANYTIDPVKLLGTFAWSPNFFGRSGDGYYLEGGVDVTLPWEFSFFGRVGYQWIENNTRFGTPDYLWYGVGISREVLLGFTASVGWYGTNISKGECVPVAERADNGQRICEGRVLFTMSKTF